MNGGRSDELWRWSAGEVSRGVRTRQISSREAVESCLDRIGEVNPRLNALAEVSPEEALDMADAADRAVGGGEPLGPLHGVPVSVKINSDQAGHATTNGIVAYAENVAEDDGSQARKLRGAGAVFVGRSNTPAFSYRWFTDNDLHGRTLNPWDEGRTPGGSSGGASSAVASGMLPIAHGNDIGGSVRYPAYACGVVGIRPTVGRLPGGGSGDFDRPLSGQMMAVQGPLARTVADLRLALDAMSGFDPADPTVVPMPPADHEPLTRPTRVGLVRDVGVVENQPAVDGALDLAAAWLGEAGYHVEEVGLPLLEEAYRLWYLLFMADFRQMETLIEDHGDEGIKGAAVAYQTAAEGWWEEEPGLVEYARGWARRGTLIQHLQTFMQDYPLILLPVSAEPALEYDSDISSVESGLRTVAAQWPMNAVATLGFPALSAPTGVTDGLPDGVQLMGRRFREDTLLDAAEVIEARAGVLTPIDPRP